jgi:hypothetical protein
MALLASAQPGAEIVDRHRRLRSPFGSLQPSRWQETGRLLYRNTTGFPHSLSNHVAEAAAQKHSNNVHMLQICIVLRIKKVLGQGVLWQLSV